MGIDEIVIKHPEIITDKIDREIITSLKIKFDMEKLEGEHQCVMIVPEPPKRKKSSVHRSRL